MMHGLMPLKASAFVRYATDDASGGQPQADPAPDSATGGDKKVVVFTKEQQDRIEEILKDRLAQKDRALERTQAEAKAAADEAAKAQEAKKLADEKRFEELVAVKQTEVEALSAKVKQAETIAEKAARYEAVLIARRDAEFGKLPEEVAELLSGKDVAEQIEWLTKYGSKFAAQTDDAGEKPAKAGGTPAPKKGRTVQSDPVQAARERQRASGLYS